MSLISGLDYHIAAKPWLWHRFSQCLRQHSKAFIYHILDLVGSQVGSPVGAHGLDMFQRRCQLDKLLPGRRSA
jgi:hypothetical protein